MNSIYKLILTIICFLLIILLLKFEIVNNFWIKINKEEFKNDKKGYRLGDIFKSNRFRKKLEKSHRELYPNSIAVEYMNRSRSEKDYLILNSIIKSRENKKILPKKNVLVIHLRCGDVIDQSKYSVNEFLESEKKYVNGLHYVKTRKYYEEISKKIKKYDIKKIVFVTGFHTIEDHSKSKDYMLKVMKIFKNDYIVEAFIDRDADTDLIYMSNSYYFVKSGGGYSRMIGNLVKLNGNILID